MKLRKLLLCLSFGFLVTTTIDVYANETDVEAPIIEGKKELLIHRLMKFNMDGIVHILLIQKKMVH